MDCAKWGLEPSGRGGVWPVPFRNKGVYELTGIIDYRGELALARRSGEISSISAHAVYEGEEFVVEYGDSERLVHKPNLLATRKDERDGLRAVYAIARLKDGGIQRAILTLAEVEKYRAKSRAGTSGPWVTDYVAMALKTALRRLCNLLPMSVEYREAIEREEAEDRDAGPIVDVGFERMAQDAQKSAADRLREKMGKAPPAPEPEPEPVVVDVEPEQQPAEEPSVVSNENVHQEPKRSPATDYSKMSLKELQAIPLETLSWEDRSLVLDLCNPMKRKEAAADTSPEPKETAAERLLAVKDVVLELLEGDLEQAARAWSATLPKLDGLTGAQAEACLKKAATLTKKLEAASRIRDLSKDLSELGRPWQGSKPAEPWVETIAQLEGIERSMRARLADVQKALAKEEVG
jgi:recombinational DNA repair protein RecT